MKTDHLGIYPLSFMKNLFTRLSLALIVLISTGHSAFAQPTASFTADVTSGCSPVLVTFTNTSTGSPTSFSWDFGDNGTSTLQNPAHSYSTPGVYTVTLIASNGSGSDTETKVSYITVFDKPQASFSTSQDSVCANIGITFVSTSTPGDAPISQYSWSFQDGTPPVSGVSTVVHNFVFSGSTPSTFNSTLLVSDTNGCNSGTQRIITVFPVPIANFTATPSGACSAPASITFNNTSQNTNAYSWTFGDTTSGSNNTSVLTNPDHTYNTTGTYPVTLIAGVTGCTATQTINITVAQPVANFSISNTSICPGDTISFTNTGSTGTFLWNFGDVASGTANTSSLQDPDHTFNFPGSYSVRLILQAGACSDTLIQNITVHPFPIAPISAPITQACDTPLTVSFSDTSSANVSWTWDFGDPTSGTLNTSSQQNPAHTFHNFGTYAITHSVTNSFGCTITRTYPSFIEIVKPIVDFTRQDSGCVNTPFTFNATVFSPADTAITDYSWNFQDGTGTTSTGTTPSITHSFTAAGQYDVSLYVTTSTGCRGVIIKPDYILIGTPPVANFSATPLVICFDENVDFTDLTPSPVTGWMWDFGDGGGSTAQNPSHQYKRDTSGTADPFDVMLIAYYNGCPDTIVLADLITVKGPIPNFSIQYNCANPFSVGFTNLSGGATSYIWDFGDTTATSTATDPTHVYNYRGDYVVTLTATSTVSGCTIDTVYTVQIRDPLAQITTDTNVVCRPGTINFSGFGSTDAYLHEWNFGEGLPWIRDTSYYRDTLHLYTGTGFYDVKYIITDIHGCKDSTTKQVHILGPTAGFSASPFTACAPMTVTFTDSSKTEGSAISQWIWNYGSTVRTITTPPGTDTLTYSIPGNYTVTLTVIDANGCSHSHTATNYIQPTRPQPSLNLPPPGCRDAQQTFTANPGPFVANPVTYAWDFGDGNFGTGASANHVYPNNGNYTIRLVVTDGNGCIDSTSNNYLVYTTPANFHTTSFVDTCVNQGQIKQAQIQTTFTIDDSSHMSNSGIYYWDFTESTRTSPLFSSVSYNFFSAGNFDVGLIVVNDFGCSDTLYKPDLVVLNGPTGTLTLAPDSGCRPLTVNFQATGNNVNYYAWDFGDGYVIPNTQDSVLSHTYTDLGWHTPQVYIAYLFDTLNNEVCLIKIPSDDSLQVTSLVGVDILEDSIIVMDGERDTLHVFTANPSGQQLIYNWTPSQFVSQDPSILNTFYASPDGATGYYYVEVAYGTTGCSGIDSVLVIYIPCEGPLVIPNVFTPNDDSKNDTYHIDDLCDLEDFKFVIYNRWGKIIFESTDIDFHWDGKTTGGTEASEGVYYYVLHTKSQDLNGYIQLIRE